MSSLAGHHEGDVAGEHEAQLVHHLRADQVEGGQGHRVLRPPSTGTTLYMRATLAGMEWTSSGGISTRCRSTTSVPSWLADHVSRMSSSVTMSMSSTHLAHRLAGALVLVEHVRGLLEREQPVVDQLVSRSASLSANTRPSGAAYLFLASPAWSFWAIAVRVLGLGDHVLVADDAPLVEGQQVRVQRHHAPAGAGLDVGGDAEGLVVADQGADGRGGDHDLEGGHAARAGRAAPAAAGRSPPPGWRRAGCGSAPAGWSGRRRRYGRPCAPRRWCAGWRTPGGRSPPR